MPQHVVVTEYDAGWPREFERESEQLARVFGSNLAAIHHIGSTSVPGLAAKPVVDIMPVVYSLEAVDFRARGLRLWGMNILASLAFQAGDICVKAEMSALIRCTFSRREMKLT